jgi:YVTN family beta-propeller protein
MRSSSVVSLCSCLCLSLLGACDPGDDPPPSTIPLAGIGRQAVYVVNGGDASIGVLDPATDEYLGEIVLENVEYPHHVYLDPSGERLLVALPGIDLSGGHAGHGGHDGGDAHGVVLALDASSGELLAHHELAAPNHNAIPSRDGSEVWTAESGTPGAVVVLDAEDLTELERIEVGDGPSEVTFSEDGAHAFVCNTASGTVSIIDTSSKEVVDELTVGTTPVGAWPGNDGSMYVDNEGSETLSVIASDSLSVVRTVALGFAPAMAAIAPTGELWVTDPEGRRVAAYATATPEDGPVRTMAVGDGAHAIAFAPDGTKAYVTNQGAGTLSVVEVMSGQVLQTVIVGQTPNGMAVRGQ